MKNSDFGKLALSFVIGATVGALAGILLAPDKGSETRKKIVDSTGDIKDKLANKIDKFVNSAVDTVVDELNKVSEGSQKIADEIEDQFS